ncbi:MAG: hypothetical protein JSR60_04370 [Proteobacteria bacterium]|nr:hypothetical protein [Pseudomonadota bacterium]
MTFAGRLVLAAAGAALLANSAAAAPPVRMRPCGMEREMVAQRSTRATTLWFRNESDGLRKLFWINFDGRRVLYSTLRPGERVEQQTYAGHPWVSTDRRGHCIAIFVPTGRSGRVDLD